MEIGNKVKIVNYGHLIWRVIDGKLKSVDYMPELIGKEGVITDKKQLFGGSFIYSVDGIADNRFVFDEQQLEKI